MSPCGETTFEGWITATVVQNTILLVFGPIVTILSLWCLWKCRRTTPGIKLQLGFVFVLMLLICTIILPGKGWINYLSFYCREDEVSDATTIFFILSTGFTIQLERMIMSLVAVYRFIAVQFPLLYQRMTTVKVVLLLEAIVCAYVSIPYILGFTQTMEVLRFDSGNQIVVFGGKNTTLYTVMYVIYGNNSLIPCLITLVAYSLMVVTLLCQKYKSNKQMKRDQVTFTLQILILIDVLLDLPHAISHFSRANRVIFTICHIIFHLHLVVDPLIFLLLNPHNRGRIQELWKAALPKSFVSFFPSLVTESSSSNLRNNVQDMSSSTKDKDQLKAHGSENSELSTASNSQILEQMLTSAPPSTGSQQGGETERQLFLTRTSNYEEVQVSGENLEMTDVDLTLIDDVERGF